MITARIIISSLTPNAHRRGSCLHAPRLINWERCCNESMMMSLYSSFLNKCRHPLIVAVQKYIPAFSIDDFRRGANKRLLIIQTTNANEFPVREDTHRGA